MPRMSDKETRIWKDRIEFSHRIWDQSGLTANSTSGDNRAWAYMNAYRGVVWNPDEPWGGLSPEDLIEVPTAFWVVNTQMSGMYARHPILDVTANRPDSIQAARRMEILINHLIRSRDLGIKRQLNRALFAGLTLPMGIVRHGFTPEREMFDADGNRIERFTPARADLPWIRSVPLWDFRADPQAESFHHKSDVRWCAFRSLITMDELERTPGLIKREDLQTTTTRDLRFTRPFDEFAVGSPPEEDNKLVEVWTVYDLEERKWFAVSDGSDKTIREPEDWPIQWDGLPYNTLGFYEQLDSPFPVAPMSMVADQLVERNKVRTIMAEYVKRMRRIIFADTNTINQDDMDKFLAGEMDMQPIFRTNGEPSSAASVFQSSDFPQGLLLYDAKIEEDIRQAFGQSLLERGQRINVESGTEAAAVAQGAARQSGLLGGNWEDFVGDVLATFGSALQSPGVLSRNFAMPILGQRDARQLLQELGKGPLDPLQPIQPQEIRGSFLYEIRPGSMAPRDAQEEIRRSVANLEVGGKFGGNVINLPQLLLEWAIAMDLDPEKVFMAPQEQQATDQVAAQQGVAPAAQGRRQGANGSGTSEGEEQVPPQLLQQG